VISWLAQFVVSGLANGAIYALVALGFTLIFNGTGIINLAQGEFVVVGGMIGVWLNQALGVPVPLAMMLAVVAGALLAVLMERIAIHPVRESPVLVLIIITVGASFFLRGLTMVLWGKDPVSMPAISGDTPIRWAGVTVVPQQLWIVGALAAVVVVMTWLYRSTWLGKAMRACESNPMAARLVGIAPSRMNMYAFALSGALAALAGTLIAPRAMVVFDQGSFLGIKGFAGAVVGGLGNPFGAMLGGVVLGVLESLAIVVLPSGYKDAVSFLILLGFLFFRPEGLLGARRGRA
jgi:branched-chain amino acid transport system permease protein